MNDKQNYEQFCLDVPRIDLFLNGDVCNQSPIIVKDYLFSNLNFSNAKLCIFLFTQTFMADFYIEESKKQTNEYLLNNEGYTIWLDTEKKTVNIQKDFKQVCIEGGYHFILDLASLQIHVDLETRIVTYTWIYEMKNTEAPISKQLIF